MVEFVRHDGGWRAGTAGDMFNVAIHLARLGHDVRFATALGRDRFSGELRERMAAEGIDQALVLTDPERQAGIYFIETDGGGERSFTYWRSDSAARRMFALTDSDRLVAGLATCDVLVFSLITLAILPREDRTALLDCAARVRASGGIVVIDGNYRPGLWPDAPSARTVRTAALSHCDLGFPTSEDEALLGIPDADAVAAEWQAGGAAEVIVKLGAAGCRLPDGTIVPPPAKLAPVDTSGAGDAFDAGFLDAHLRGCGLRDAAEAGHRLAAWVIMHSGAAPERTPSAPYPAKATRG